MIYSRISKYIFRQLILPTGVDEKYSSLYSYGLEVILSSFFNMIVLFILSGALNVFTEMLCFLLTFIPLRLYGRGAHASSHFKCLFLFSVSMIGSIGIGTALSNTGIYQPLMIVGLIGCMLIQYRFSIVPNRDSRQKESSLLALPLPWIICLLSGASLFTSIEPKYTVIGVFGIYVQTISLLIKNIKGE